MYVNEDELIRLVEVGVKARLEVEKRPKVSRGWRVLRKEISEYCDQTCQKWEEPAYSGVQNAIYTPIRYALRVNRIDEITDEQAKSARRIFEFIKAEAGLQRAHMERK
ncbi:hypothetical protein D8911_11670 [Levilactobacillus brevis]|nr:hypothetical protein D8911_11670 [Levilactobacillus brevis]